MPSKPVEAHAADLELARQCRDGHVGAFEEVYRAHAGRLYSVLVRMIGAPAEAEDLLQEVFLRAYGGWTARYRRFERHMDCATHEADLSAYIDGEIGSNAALDAHLAACARCRALSADLRAIRTAARTLGAEPPPVRVWPRISAALDQEEHRGVLARLRSVVVARPLAATAAAAGLTIAVWAGWAVGRSGSADVAGTPALSAEMRMAEEQYTTAIHGLEQIVQAESAALDPDTAGVLEAHLEVIDQAIGESRAVLETEPGNELALESLFDLLRSKVQLLLDSVALISAMSQGDQAAAARIASEPEQ